MNRIISFVLAVMLVFASCDNYIPVIYAAEGTDELSVLNNLISTGTLLTDSDSTEAFMWAMNVQQYNDTHINNKFYNEIKKECDYMIHNYVYDEHRNKTIAYLTIIKEELEGVLKPTLTELIECGKNLSDSDSLEAFVWVLHTRQYILNSTDLAYANEITQECNYMIHNSAYQEHRNKTIAYLTVLSNEKPYIISNELIEIDIIDYPDKTDYVEGERFDPTGLKIAATYQKTWSNGYVDYSKKENIRYFYDDTQILTRNTSYITISYMENGITKTKNISIYVDYDPDPNVPISEPGGGNGLNDRTSDPITDEELYRLPGRTAASLSSSSTYTPNIKSIKKLKIQQRGKKITFKWRKIKKARGYQIQISRSKSFYSRIKINTLKPTASCKKLKKGKKYYLRVRAYVKHKNKKGKKKKIYGSWALFRIKIK